MARGKNAKVASRGNQPVDKALKAGNFVAVHRDDIRLSVYPHPQGVSHAEAERTALQPIDWTTRKLDMRVPKRVVITIEEFNTHKNEKDPVSYSKLHSS